MEAQLEQIREQQKESWNKFSVGWKKWDTLTMQFLKPAGDEIICQLDIKGNETVLDVAAGTGEPGLTIATMLTMGKVVSTDISEGMLEVARENAALKGIKNFETQVCDVSDLPFADNTFDAISCRFGFMFFPDMEQALNEMKRVLKPGGKISTSIWNGPEKNFWIIATMSNLNKIMELPQLPPGAPGIFRCAQPGLITDLFKRAGLKNVYEKEVHGKLNTGTPDMYWNYMTDVVAPVVGALAKADEATKTKVKNAVYDSLKQKYPDGNIAIDASSTVIYGEK